MRDILRVLYFIASVGVVLAFGLNLRNIFSEDEDAAARARSRSRGLGLLSFLFLAAGLFFLRPE